LVESDRKLHGAGALDVDEKPQGLVRFELEWEDEGGVVNGSAVEEEVITGMVFSRFLAILNFIHINDIEKWVVDGHEPVAIMIFCIADLDREPKGRLGKAKIGGVDQGWLEAERRFACEDIVDRELAGGVFVVGEGGARGIFVDGIGQHHDPIGVGDR
jgi:hypothetical protein